MKDEIVLRLNETLKNFLHFFTNDLQKKVLELEKNAESSSNYKQLERISNSLEQYLEIYSMLGYLVVIVQANQVQLILFYHYGTLIKVEK